jgi:hypothetical protein
MTKVPEEVLEEHRIASKHRGQEDGVSGTVEKEDGDTGTEHWERENEKNRGS